MFFSIVLALLSVSFSSSFSYSFSFSFIASTYSFDTFFNSFATRLASLSRSRSAFLCSLASLRSLFSTSSLLFSKSLLLLKIAPNKLPTALPKSAKRPITFFTTSTTLSKLPINIPKATTSAPIPVLIKATLKAFIAPVEVPTAIVYIFCEAVSNLFAVMRAYCPSNVCFSKACATCKIALWLCCTIIILLIICKYFSLSSPSNPITPVNA